MESSLSDLIKKGGVIGMAKIRRATVDDASRIAEILVFSKRKNYREIFNDDISSFVGLQVYPLAKSYIARPSLLENVFVYDDEFVKAMMRIGGSELKELYVDPFFEGKGIGGEMITFAIRKFDCHEVWVLDRNTRAKNFYMNHGFKETEETREISGTKVFDRRMTR